LRISRRDYFPCVDPTVWVADLQIVMTLQGCLINELNGSAQNRSQNQAR